MRLCRVKSMLLCGGLLLLISYQSIFGVEVIERRKPQSGPETEIFGYYMVPYPLRIPGIGESLAAVSGFNNINNTPVSFFGGLFFGDLKGRIFALYEIPLIGELLRLDLFSQYFSDIAFKSYTKRGMESSKDGFNTVILKDQTVTGGNITIWLWEQRLSFNTTRYTFKATIDSVLDKDNKEVVSSGTSPKMEETTENYALNFDFTDDRKDPRRGISYNVSRGGQPHAPNKDNPDYYQWDQSIKFYIPVLRESTIAFNLFDSRSQVLREGLTDRDALWKKNGFDCSKVPTEGQEICEKAVNEVIDQQIASNKFGSSASLGGLSRLRSFSQNRFNGSQTQFIGTEFRWNLSSEKFAYDVFFAKDTKTLFQLAFFAEAGSVTDDRSKLWDKYVTSVGSGIRVVTEAGFVMRLELGLGSEGHEVIIFINYPWSNYGN